MISLQQCLGSVFFSLGLCWVMFVESSWYPGRRWGHVWCPSHHHHSKFSSHIKRNLSKSFSVFFTVQFILFLIFYISLILWIFFPWFVYVGMFHYIFVRAVYWPLWILQLFYQFSTLIFLLLNLFSSICLILHSLSIYLYQQPLLVFFFLSFTPKFYSLCISYLSSPIRNIFLRCQHVSPHWLHITQHSHISSHTITSALAYWYQIVLIPLITAIN